MDKSTDNQKTRNQASATPDQGIFATAHTLFLGEYTHKVDDKGRLALPAKFRVGLQDGAVVTRGMDGCLHLFALEQWKPLADKLAQQPLYSNPEVRKLQREVLGGATPVTPDRQGRILLPANLREYVGLGSKTAEVVVAGLSGRIEIWPAKRWKTERQETDLDEIAPKLADLGI